jgi:hypothetical protein
MVWERVAVDTASTEGATFKEWGNCEEKAETTHCLQTGMIPKYETTAELEATGSGVSARRRGGAKAVFQSRQQCDEGNADASALQENAELCLAPPS